MEIDVKVGNPSVEITLLNLARNDKPSNSSKGKKKAPALEQLKVAICKHQGEIAQAIYLSLEYHKRLRLAFEEGDDKVATESMHALENVCERHFREAWKGTVEYLKNYFSATRNEYQYLPRICLKGTSPNSNGNTIIDIYRGEQAGRSDRSYAVAENTALSFVKIHGSAYFCNDIPAEVRQDKYLNPRLNQTKAIHYSRDGRITNLFRRKREICSKWTNCWVDQNPKTPINHYRSTIVVPLTLINNDLDSDFINSTIIGISREVERTIYGFLCLDHPAVGYFRPDDIAATYICADLLSFHLMNRQALIHSSRTVGEFCNAYGYKYKNIC